MTTEAEDYQNERIAKSLLTGLEAAQLGTNDTRRVVAQIWIKRIEFHLREDRAKAKSRRSPQVEAVPA